ncbi:MAG: hypothetical protein J5710_10495 [Treponema sp.]|nr:hypothetical protein [Treponema sp.]
MLRSIKKALDDVKAKDAETAVTTYSIRKWCKEGKIKHIMTGKKILVDMQSLYDYLSIK